MSIWSAITKRATTFGALSLQRGMRSKGQGKGERWTPQEDALIKEWYARKPVLRLARKLRRSVPAVRNRARILGVRLRSRKTATDIQRTEPARTRDEQEPFEQ